MRTSEQHSPLQVVVLQPHVGVLGIAFSHDGVPQFSGFLHVLTVEGLTESTQTGQHQRHTMCSHLYIHNCHRISDIIGFQIGLPVLINWSYLSIALTDFPTRFKMSHNVFSLVQCTLIQSVMHELLSL